MERNSSAKVVSLFSPRMQPQSRIRGARTRKVGGGSAPPAPPSFAQPYALRHLEGSVRTRKPDAQVADAPPWAAARLDALRHIAEAELRANPSRALQLTRAPATTRAAARLDAVRHIAIFVRDRPRKRAPQATGSPPNVLRSRRRHLVTLEVSPALHARLMCAKERLAEEGDEAMLEDVLEVLLAIWLGRG